MPAIVILRYSLYNYRGFSMAPVYSLVRSPTQVCLPSSRAMVHIRCHIDKVYELEEKPHFLVWPAFPHNEPRI